MVSGPAHPYAEGAPDRRYANADLLPAGTGEFRRRWRDFAAVRVRVSWSPAHLTPSGMPGQDRFTWPRTLLICLVAQAAVLLPSLLVEPAGDRYGVPFAVFARSAFGVRGPPCLRCCGSSRRASSSASGPTSASGASSC
ncbi:SLC5/6 family protein [Streptomyces omiyaensis]|uniref:Uncharacterized protein n=1 Tax=Streptomyces omiyaensis TaxID=68247 RepID=A0ABW7C2K1_9ACTN